MFKVRLKMRQCDSIFVVRITIGSKISMIPDVKIYYMWIVSSMIEISFMKHELG